MLENARRQLILVLLVAAGAIVALSTLKLNRGLDLSGGVQLIYEVDIEKAKRDGTIPADATQDQIAKIIDETVAIIAERIDPQGTIEAVVTRRGDTGILIELPKMTDTETRAIEARVENLGRLEFRIVAQDTYSEDGVQFRMADEVKRLEEWLAADDGANRELVADDPQAIRVFNNDPSADVGPISDQLAWKPRVIRPSVDDASRWTHAFSWNELEPNPANPYHAVAAFTPQQWNNRIVPDGAKFLVEFVPLNLHERAFTGEDLDPSAIRPGLDEFGRPSILYRMRPESETAYADWSEKYTQEFSAILLNEVVYSAPRFLGRILGNAQITGDFTQREVNELVKTLRTGSLKVKPVQQSRAVIGATLGAQSIRLAFISMGVGAALTLGFILWYYRLAGLVAFAALALNILLILAVVVLLRSTLTLPGLAGLVLTMGMAIDANILIYERIREELGRGKEMLQACRTGFDRAIVTILDANLTTFIAGVVLYNVGVGPVRGFAVTLMIGILTTLFTAFFVSRLVFHYLLEAGKFTEFKVAAWFRDANFDFLQLAKRAVIVSLVVIGAGLVSFLTTTNDEKYAIDFTGGANLKVVLAQPLSVDEVRNLLHDDAEFSKLFPKPIVNTIGAVEGGNASEFAIRLKLTEELRAQIDAERAAQGDDYEPPYKTELARVLGDRLVPDAYSAARVDEIGDSSSTDFASIKLHFAVPVAADQLHEALRGLSREVLVTREDGEQVEGYVGRDFLVQWDVARGTSSAMLFPQVQSEVDKLVDASGERIALSNPIPESTEIGGRMVGELRNSAVTALFVAMFGIVMYIRVRFHEYKYGIAAVVAVFHDVLVTAGAVVFFNHMHLVDAEIDLAMIAAFLTIIGYSINDTIVIFDRVRENLSDAQRLGGKIDRKEILNLSINQTLSRTILTSATTMAVMLTQFIVNFHAGTALEGFSFALVVGLIAGTYSTMFIATPIVMWLWKREGTAPSEPVVAGSGESHRLPAESQV